MGYQLPYESMTVGNRVSYDGSNFYVNELRTKGADPGVVYYSGAEIADSYAKLRAYYAQVQSVDAFNAKYGTLEQFQAKYADLFYMAVTSYRNSVSSEQASELGIPQAQYSTFQFYTSKNLSAWKRVEKANGDAFFSESGTWVVLGGNYTWAPELIRDPVSGLFLIYFNTASAEATSENKLGTVSSSEESTTKQLCVGYSETPDGPYRLLTGEEYYNRICEHTNRTVKTVSEGGKTYAVYRSDIRSGNTKLTEMKNGQFVNQNGETVGKMDPLLNFIYYHVDGYQGIGTGKGVATQYPGPGSFMNVLGSSVRGKLRVIDAHPFIDSNGTMFVYFVVEGNGIWTIRMQDIVTPVWSTLTRVAAPKFSSVFHSDSATAAGILGRNMQTLGEQEENNVNEGVFVVENGGFFYLFYSRKGLAGSQNQTDYDVLVAVADNPFGPFIKVPDCNPVIGYTAGNDFMKGTGHCSMVKAGSEYWCVYCANIGSAGRSIGADKVTFQPYDGLTFNGLKSSEITTNVAKGSAATSSQMNWSFSNHNGQTYTVKGSADSVLAMPFGNGPTYSVQPSPTVTNDRRNVLRDADCTVTVVSGDASTAKYINDGMFSAVERSRNFETRSEGDTLEIRFDFASPKKVNSILVYSPFDRANAVDKISGIRFALSEKPAWYPSGETYSGVCSISNLAYESYAFGNGSVRRGVSANAVFREITVSSVTVTVAKKDLLSSTGELRLSEIVLMGTDAAGESAASMWTEDRANNAFGELPDLTQVRINAEKGASEGWTTVPLTASAQSGKVAGNLQTQFSEGGLYILLDVADQFGVSYALSEMNEMETGAGGTDKHTCVSLEVKTVNGQTSMFCADSHNFVPYDKRDSKWFNGAVRRASIGGTDHFILELYITWDQLGANGKQDVVYLKADYKYRQNKTINSFSLTAGEPEGYAVFNKLGLSVLPVERTYTISEPFIPANGYGIKAISMSYVCEIYGSESTVKDQAYMADGKLDTILPFVSVKSKSEMNPVVSVFNESEIRRYEGNKTGLEYYDFIKLELCEASDVGVLKWYVGGNKLNIATEFDLYVSNDGLIWEWVNYARKDLPLEYVADGNRNYCTAIEINRSDVKYIFIGIMSGRPLADKLEYAVQEISVMDRSYEFKNDADFFPKDKETADPSDGTTAPQETEAPKPKKKGCGSAFGGNTAILLLTVAAFAVCFLKMRRKRRQKGEKSV